MLVAILCVPLGVAILAALLPARARRAALGPRLAGDARALDRARCGLRHRRPRASVRRRRELDPRPGRALPARRRRHQPVPRRHDRAPLGRDLRLVGLAAARPPEELLPHARDRRVRGHGRLPRAGPPALRPLLRPDAGAVLLPGRQLRHRRPRAGDDQDDGLHAGRLAADAGGGDRDRGPHRRDDGRALVRDGGPARERPARGKPGVDLPLLRRGVPGQDADLPAPRLDARRLPRRAAAGARAALGRPAEGRRLRLPARRPADLPRRDGPVPGADPGARPRLGALRLR